MENCIEIKNLCKKYEEFTLNNISFSVKTGCVMGFIGENGAGKTTTLKSILNLIKKDSGSIKIFGLDNVENEEKIKKDIAVVFDDINFPPSFNALKINKMMKNTISNWEEDTFFKYVERFRLSKKKAIKDFSRGMKMKLSIAVALSHNAKLLILDEATSGLDPMVRNEILDVFLEFMEDETHTILISSHIISDLEKVADYITFIHDGKVLFSKEKYDILEEHGLLKCKASQFDKVDKKDIIAYRKSDFGYDVLTDNIKECKTKYPDITVDKVNIEDIMLFYSMRRD